MREEARPLEILSYERTPFYASPLGRGNGKYICVPSLILLPSQMAAAGAAGIRPHGSF